MRERSTMNDSSGQRAGADEFLEPWLGLTKVGKGTSLSTVRAFVDTIEKAVPDVGLAERRKVVDAALEMTQGLLHRQYEFVRGAVRSAVLIDVDVNVGVDVDVASRKRSI
jgi:hypothetical protein